MQALPDHIPQLWNPSSNIAGLSSGLAAAVAPPLNPNRRAYYAYDGTPIGYGNDCDPISMEPELSGMMVPDFLEENRLETMQEWALPALVGTMTLAATGRALPTALWALGAYMAPLPVAAFMGWSIVSRMPSPGLSGLGQHWGERFRPGPWRTGHKCVRWKRVTMRDGTKVRRCMQFKPGGPHSAARRR